MMFTTTTTRQAEHKWPLNGGVDSGDAGHRMTYFRRYSVHAVVQGFVVHIYMKSLTTFNNNKYQQTHISCRRPAAQAAVGNVWYSSSHNLGTVSLFAHTYAHANAHIRTTETSVD